MKQKIFINSFIFFILLIIIALILSKILILKENFIEDKTRLKVFYEEPKGTIDVVFIGPSCIYTGYNNLIAWHNFGITSLILAFDNFPISANKYFIKEIMNVQKPKLIVISIDNCQLSITDKFAFKKNIKYLNYFKFSLNKLLLINAINKEYKQNLGDKVSNSELLGLYFPVLIMHTRWKFLDRKINKKYTNIVSTIPKGIYIKDKFYSKNKRYNPDMLSFSILTDYKLYLFKDLFEFINKNNVPVILINSPNEFLYRNKEKYIEYHKQFLKVYKLAEEYNIPYIDLFDESKIKEMDIKQNDFSDQIHLNFYGSTKYTKYLTKILQEKYNIVDKRSKKEYNDWNIDYMKYKNFLMNNYNIEIN